MIAFHFPPCTGTSGVLRSLKFSRYLPESGWQPVLLTVHPRAYEETDMRSEKSIPEELRVVRAFALDVKRHLGLHGLFPDWLAIPDRWGSWLLGAVPSGLRAIRKYRVDVIFSTFPVCTAVLSGFLLHLLTGKPWVVDLRDSMTEDNYPPEKFRRRIWRWIEEKAMQHASRVIFTAASTRRMYLRRYPRLAPEKCLLISNGYDEEDFQSLTLSKAGPIPADRPLQLLHTGMLYPEERDPKPFFRAISRLKCEGKISAANLRISLRAPSSEDFYRRILSEFQIEDLIEILPSVLHHQALQECADADGLLLFQAANCDHQIPAKAYEYLRSRKPIFALTSRTGDTAALLNEVGGATIVDLADEGDIYRVLPDYLNALRGGLHPLADSQKIMRYSRRSQAAQLAGYLSELKRES
jgi:glycosyltransferase involved in cell wall biosynthesis